MDTGLKTSGGEGGIRTLGTGVSPYNGLANRRIRPLCHLSGVCGPSVYHVKMGTLAASITNIYATLILANLYAALSSPQCKLFGGVIDFKTPNLKAGDVQDQP